MSNNAPRIIVDLVENKLDVESIVEEMINFSSRLGGGALAVFIGYVKQFVDGKEVFTLEYTSYKPYAIEVLRRIAEDATREYEGVHEVRIVHRLGSLPPGDTTLYIFVAGVSRKTVIPALEYILERVKYEAPIYKLEKREDGEYWVIGDNRTRRPAQS